MRVGRFHRAARWSGLAACALLLGVYVLSMRGYVWYRGDWWGVHVNNVGMAAAWFTPHSYPRGWTALWVPNAILPDWRFHHESIRLGQSGFMSWISVPVWAVLLPCAGLTWRLWRRERTPKPGRCRCGYDLTGNLSGICPECGVACRASAEAH